MHKLCLQRPRICRCQLNREIMVENQAILFRKSKEGPLLNFVSTFLRQLRRTSRKYCWENVACAFS
jgi:hypothetical protein